MQPVESAAPNAAPARRPRWKRRLLLGGLVVLALSIALPYAYFAIAWDYQLRDALAEADRLEPEGWHLRDVEVGRPAVADDQNSALVLMNAKPLLPRKWPFWDFTDDQTLPSEEREALQKSFDEFDPSVQLDARQIKALRAELSRAAGPLERVRQIADLPRGRYPITYTPDFFGTLLPYTQESRTFARLLGLDVMLRAQDRDLDGALSSCRAILGASRSVGDEPLLISTLVRIAIDHIAARHVERVLAQGTPSEAALATMQRALEEQLREPILLQGLRGERAGQDTFMEGVQSGEITIGQIERLFDSPKRSEIPYLAAMRFTVMMGTIKSSRAALLQYNTRLIEIARRPVAEQPALFKEAEEAQKRLPLLARYISSGAARVAQAYHRDQAMLQAAILMVAAERFRRARGRWPESIGELVPTYLAAVPIDPFDGQPMRLRRRADGLVLYSVGLDGVDNGGNVERNDTKPGTDWGVRLWDTDKRRRPPAK
jgi:hypothetical protein